jgi:hypothetical protein
MGIKEVFNRLELSWKLKGQQGRKGAETSTPRLWTCPLDYYGSTSFRAFGLNHGEGESFGYRVA